MRWMVMSKLMVVSLMGMSGVLGVAGAAIWGINGINTSSGLVVVAATEIHAPSQGMSSNIATQAAEAASAPVDQGGGTESDGLSIPGRARGVTARGR